MDVGSPRGVSWIDQNILVEQMLECQNRLDEQYSSRLNRIVAQLTSLVKFYLDHYHPGVAVPHNGPHFQVVRSSLKELALLIAEVSDFDEIICQCIEMSDRLQSRMIKIKEENSMESIESIRNTMTVITEMREDCERRVRRLILHFKKILDLAKRPIGDTTHLGILWKGVSSVYEEMQNEFLLGLETMLKLLEKMKEEEESWQMKVQDLAELQMHVDPMNANRKEDLLVELPICDDVRMMEGIMSHFRKRLMQAKTRNRIDPDVVDALLHFIYLPRYWEAFIAEGFNDRTKCIFSLVYGTPQDEDEVNKFKGLETLPYDVLNSLLEMTPSLTKEGRNLRRKMVDDKAINFVVDQITAIAPAASRGSNVFGVESRSCTSTDEEQRKENKVACLLTVLANFIGTQTRGRDRKFLSEFNVLLKNSSLMPVLSRYLEMDSVLEFAGHVPLYRVIFRLLGFIASIPQLWSLLISSGEGDSLILKSLNKLTNAVTTFPQLLEVSSAHDCLDLMQLLPVIQETATQVDGAVMEFLKGQQEETEELAGSRCILTLT